jgi:hypothetical protein
VKQQQISDPVVRRVLAGWVTALTRPRVATFTTLIRQASWSGVLLSLLVGGSLAGLLRALSGGVGGPGPVEAFISGLISDVVIFCIVTAYLLLTTRVATNAERQVQQVYALSLFWPLLIIPLSLLPVGGLGGFLGTFLWLPATIYALYLTYLVVQAVPGLSSRSARFVILVPVILLVIIGMLIWGLFLLLSGNLNTIENK